jgi:uncharacterized lipoprotein YbaY
MTATTRRVPIVVAIAVVGFLLAFLIPRSDVVSVFGRSVHHHVNVRGTIQLRSDVLLPLRAVVQMAIILFGGIAANLMALLGGKEKSE